jgi:hypothetical protein
MAAESLGRVGYIAIHAHLHTIIALAVFKAPNLMHPGVMPTLLTRSWFYPGFVSLDTLWDKHVGTMTSLPSGLPDHSTKALKETYFPDRDVHLPRL